MSDREITLELPDDLLQQAEFAVALGDVPSVSAYIAQRATLPREPLVDALDRWDREQEVTADEAVAADELVRQRMAADDARWATLRGESSGQVAA